MEVDPDAEERGGASEIRNQSQSRNLQHAVQQQEEASIASQLLIENQKSCKTHQEASIAPIRCAVRRTIFEVTLKFPFDGDSEQIIGVTFTARFALATGWEGSELWKGECGWRCY